MTQVSARILSEATRPPNPNAQKAMAVAIPSIDYPFRLTVTRIRHRWSVDQKMCDLPLPVQDDNEVDLLLQAHQSFDHN